MASSCKGHSLAGPPCKEQSIKQRLLEATFPHLPFDGWTDKSLRQGAKAVGIGTAGLLHAFPGGVSEAVAFFNQYANQQLAGELGRANLSKLRLKQRVALAARVRLQLLEGKREAVRVTCSHLSLPANLGLAGRLLWQDVDAIWRAAGDRSFDTSYYTKRAMLLPVWLSTLLYWLNDYSPESRDSWEFLDRRLEGVMQLGNLGRLRCPELGLPSPWRLARQLRARGWEISL